MAESKRTLMALIAAAAVLCLILLSLRMAPKPYSYDASQDQISLLSIDPADVVFAQTERNGQRHVYRQVERQWFRDDVLANYNEIDLLITCMSYLYSDNLISEPAADMSLYGLSPAEGVGTFQTKDGRSYTVSFGIQTVDGKSRYMMLSGDPQVYTIPVETFDIIFALDQSGRSCEQ